MLSDYFFRSQVTLYRVKATKDKAGGAKRQWAAVADPVSACIQPISSREIQAWAARQVTVSHRVYTREELPYKRGDKLIDDRGRTFRVRGNINVASFDTIWHLDCMEVLK